MAREAKGHGLTVRRGHVTRRGLAVATLSLVAFGATDGQSQCSKSSATTASWTGSKNIVETAVAAGKFETLAAALKAAGLVDALQGEGPFTVFAPTDDAFAALPDGTVESLLKPENRGLLTSILTFHVVPGRVMAADVVKLDSAQALNGQRIAIETSDAGVSVAGVDVIKTDIGCSHGVIHVADRVRMPATKNIVETAVSAGSFSTLAAALRAAGLVETLAGDGPFTVFAPTDDAFAALPDGTVENLLKPENKDKLVAILKFHVVPGRVYADQLSNGQHVGTAQGSEVAIALDDHGAKVNDARIVATDVDTTNGVIHVIDKVLLPQ